ncbi:hypothetical protein DNTS_000582 [Danionella cerebrum]|uniref:Contactin-3 n=1 Tax=Danionella cerebrum TaxID=2873325 RepID=A0A553NWH5_9TELE|nr:hypothetical protein DNTS_000582 [Danionella translucida]
MMEGLYSRLYFDVSSQLTEHQISNESNRGGARAPLPLKSDQWGGIKGIPTDGGDPGGLQTDSRPDSRADKARLGLVDPFAPPAILHLAFSPSLSSQVASGGDNVAKAVRVCAAACGQKNLSDSESMLRCQQQMERRLSSWINITDMPNPANVSPHHHSSFPSPASAAQLADEPCDGKDYISQQEGIIGALTLHGGERLLDNESILALYSSLFLELLIQADHFPLQCAVVRFESFQTAVVVQLLLLVCEHQAASTLAYPDRSEIARFTHVSIHIFEVEHLAAAFIPTFGWGIIAHLRVLRQMLQLDDLLAAPRDQVFEREDVVELFGGDPLAFHWAAALLDDPRQDAAGAEDVTAREKGGIRKRSGAPEEQHKGLESPKSLEALGGAAWTGASTSPDFDSTNCLRLPLGERTEKYALVTFIQLLRVTFLAPASSILLDELKQQMASDREHRLTSEHICFLVNESSGEQLFTFLSRPECSAQACNFPSLEAHNIKYYTDKARRQISLQLNQNFIVASIFLQSSFLHLNTEKDKDSVPSAGEILPCRSFTRLFALTLVNFTDRAEPNSAGSLNNCLIDGCPPETLLPQRLLLDKAVSGPLGTSMTQHRSWQRTLAITGGLNPVDRLLSLGQTPEFLYCVWLYTVGRCERLQKLGEIQLHRCHLLITLSQQEALRRVGYHNSAFHPLSCRRRRRYASYTANQPSFGLLCCSEPIKGRVCAADTPERHYTSHIQGRNHSVHKQLDESHICPWQLKMTLLWKRLVVLSIIDCLTVSLAEEAKFLGPSWKREPEDLILPIHSPEQEALLTCEASGVPSPQYRWSLNGTLIDLLGDERRRLSGGNLIITSLDRDQDSGLYQCTASNSRGSILSRRATLQFAYLENFKTQTRSAVNVREGQGVVLLCGTPSYSGELTFTWVFNEFPYFVQQDSRRFVSQETGNLYIAKVEPSDVGNYTCVVNNTITKERVFSSPTPLVLRNDGAMGEYEPKIELHFPDTIPAAKGSVLKLECFALGNPVPRISWRRTSDVSFPSKVKQKNSNAILEIPSFQQEDTGTYECLAENSRGKNAVRGRLSFHATPHWLQTMADTALSIEENLFWECKANGKPKPSYSWLKNGETLTPEGRVQIENGALSISSLNLADGGMYQCVAENKHGIIYSSAELMVLASAPSFSQDYLTRVLKARSGTDVSLDCRPRASPRAISLWKRGNEILQRNERIYLFPNGTLKITNVTKRDGGMYTCIAKNQFGTASTTARLIITEATRVSQGPGSSEITVGESIVLPCQVTADPALDVAFSWAFNGQPIDFHQDADHFERVGGSFSGDLMIRNIQLNHGGKYVCLVDTDVESLSTDAILVVKGPPSPPDLVVVEEVTDSTAQLSWSPGQDNGSPITGYATQARTPFTVGWQAVDTVPEVINGNTLTATVVGLNAWVEYEFRVLASNIVGIGEPSPPSTKIRTEDAIPDTAPTDVGGGGGTKSELVITWEPVPEELQNGEGFGYIIAFRSVGMVTWTRVVISAPSLTRYVYRNDTIPPFSPFSVKVGAFNNRGEGPFSTIATVFSAEEVPSVAPGKLSAKSLSAADIEVTWEPLVSIAERVLGYEVVYWEDDTKPDTVGKMRITGNSTAVNVSNLQGNTPYYLAVCAFNTAGSGPQSVPVNVTTKKPPPGQPPQNVEWNLIGSQLILQWDPVIALETESEVTGYIVLYRRHGNNDMLSIITTKTTLELTLNPNDNYVIQIKTISEGGLGEGSEPIHIHQLSMGARGSRVGRLCSLSLSPLLICALSTLSAS